MIKQERLPSSEMFMRAAGVGIKSPLRSLVDNAFNAAMTIAKITREKRDEDFRNRKFREELEYKRDKMKQELELAEAQASQSQAQFERRAGQTDQYISQAGERLRGQKKRDIVSAAESRSRVAQRAEGATERKELKTKRTTFAKRVNELRNQYKDNPTGLFDVLMEEMGADPDYAAWIRERFGPKEVKRGREKDYSKIGRKASMIGARETVTGMDKRSRDDAVERSGMKLSDYIKGLADEIDIRRQRVMDELRGRVSSDNLEAYLQKASVANLQTLLEMEQDLGLAELNVYQKAWKEMMDVNK
jgi:hypothetical protein